MVTTEKELSVQAKQNLSIFRRALPMQVKLHEIIRSLGSTEKLVCLDIGAENAMMSYYLRKKGGEWHSAVTGQRECEAMNSVVGDNVYVMDGKTLPFKKSFFDVLVIIDYLERAESDESFIEECHRVLKPDGRLIVNVAHIRPWMVLRPMQQMMGLTYDKKGLVRPGYSESQLFNILKHGFDVHNMHSYSRFFVELTDTFAQFFKARAKESDPGNEKKIKNIYSLAFLPYRIAYQFDMLLFFTRGYNLIATAKRRAWRPRNTPVLVDGRSISEAVLHKALD
ncbi:MAG: class I SAM-dependent methyltransferase [Kiritimatiellae bacterium]|nr:class I SAM-dependent methyltransferase [Kiritimatiellia bacterium]MDD5520927.1 class I SAM-dependent methyltransferase [Kiritimatiellia bacterium]